MSAANTKFDIQLGRGLKYEGRAKEMLEGAKIEVKTETHQWEQTGNICIEYEYNGKPSGIAATEADLWMHQLVQGDDVVLVLLWPVKRLKELCRMAYNAGFHRSGAGDGGKSKVILLPLDRLF